MAPSGRRRRNSATRAPSEERRKGTGDRRRNRPEAQPPKAGGSVTFDDKGNAVWEWRLETPMRREDDPTIDYLKILDVDGLAIEEEQDVDDATDDTFNPYSRD